MPEPGKDWETAAVAEGCSAAVVEEAERTQAALRDVITRGVAVKDLDVSRRGEFSRVLGVEYSSGVVLFPEAADAPARNSPSRRLAEEPHLVKDGIRSTMRLQVIDRTGDLIHATAFSVSPSFAITCDHHVGDVLYRAMAGGLVQKEAFDVAERERYHLKLVERKQAGLALLKISRHGFSKPPNAELGFKFCSFLLPCLPTSEHCVVVSFPGITAFLLRAHEELVEGKIQGGTRLWDDVYKIPMKQELESLRFKNKYWSEISIQTAGKRTLYRKLLEAFSSHSSGCMTCALGYMQSTKQGIATTTCSTLYGSSGGPVCSLNKPGYYFVGIHSGATEDYRFNEATTCDNAEFAPMYLQHVLGDLPPPDSKSWEGWDLDPFFSWLLYHEAFVRTLKDVLGDAQKKWFRAAQERQTVWHDNSWKRLRTS